MEDALADKGYKFKSMATKGFVEDIIPKGGGPKIGSIEVDVTKNRIVLRVQNRSSIIHLSPTTKLSKVKKELIAGIQSPRIPGLY